MNDRGRGEGELAGAPLGQESSGAPSLPLCWQTMELFRLSLGCICLLPWLEGKFLLLWGSWKLGSELPCRFQPVFLLKCCLGSIALNPPAVKHVSMSTFQGSS